MPTILAKRQLGKLTVSDQGLGCMGMSEFYGATDQTESLKTLERAFDLGVDFYDTADAYGYGANEELLSAFIKNHQREELIIATKCGILRDENDPVKRGVNNRPEYILQCCDASLKRLSVEYIDLYYLHRINEDADGIGAPLEESMQAFAKLLLQGKIRHVGISESTAEQMKRTHALLLKYTDGKHGLTAIQSEYSLLTRTPEVNGVLKACKELDIGFVAYSPLCRQLLTEAIESTDIKFSPDDFRKNLPRFTGDNLAKNLDIAKRFREIATAKNCTLAQLAIAWVMAQGDYIVPIPGTKKVKYLEENLKASDVKLNADDLKTLDKLAPYGIAAGERYIAASMKAFHMTE